MNHIEGDCDCGDWHSQQEILEMAAEEFLQNFGEPETIYHERGTLKRDGKWTAIGRAFLKWFRRDE